MKTPYTQRFQPVWTLALFLLLNVGFFFLARLAYFFFLWPSINANSWDTLAQGLYIGLKFDARFAVFLSLPLALVLLVPWLENRLRHGPVRKALLTLEGLLFSLSLLIVVLDFGFFFYLRQRLDFTALEFAKDPLISATMVWQSYPVLLIALAFALIVSFYIWLLKKILAHHSISPLSRSKRAVLTIACLFGLFLMGYGQISSNLFPLRWSNAYFSTDPNISLLALHPLQNLYDTRRFGQVTPPNVPATVEAYPRMAEWLGISPTQVQQSLQAHGQNKTTPLNFMRHFPGVDMPLEKRPNVVFLLMESLAWPRTSFAPGIADGKANATPFIKTLSEKGLYFSNFYAPSRTTARAIFTSITGTPDVNHSGGTTSRNPILVDQFTIFNEFQDYAKYYMLGGSASWANIRGLLQSNIADLQLYEEDSWLAPNVDVWGISDLTMLQEASDIFSSGSKPFIAFVQTAGFHRPYTIPDNNMDFDPGPDPSPAELAHYGFESLEEYRSMRFSDHALRRFFDKASKEPWFENTIFAIFGDHGLNNPSANVSPGYLATGLQAWHTPLVLYGPKYIQPGVNSLPYSQLDLFPTMAQLAQIPHRVNTLGRNLINHNNDQNAQVYITVAAGINHLIKDGYVYSNSPHEVLYRLDNPLLENLADKDPQRMALMRQATNDFYYSSSYLLFNNPKPRGPAPLEPPLVR